MQNITIQGIPFDIPSNWEDMCELKEELESFYKLLDNYEKCEACKGTGGSSVSYEDSKGRIIDVDYPCNACNGSGYVEKISLII